MFDESRRKFLGHTALGVAVTALSACLPRARTKAFKRLSPEQLPIVEVGAEQSMFSGDDFTRPHGILWNKPSVLANARPESEPDANLVIVGAGVAGLTAAYLLRDYEPIVLEQAKQVGGNSRGERFSGVDFSIGAAYVSPPEPGGRIEAFFKELGILSELRHSEGGGGAFLHGGALHEGFWRGASDPTRADEFARVFAALRKVYDTSLPILPPGPDAALTQEQLVALDGISLADWVTQNLGDIHPHIREFFEEYCWSTFGGTQSELSAAQALSFLAADVQGIAAFPGGNSRITHALAQKLDAALPAGHVRTQCLVADVASNGRGVEVLYQRPDGRLSRIRAKACVVATPKFIASKVVSGLSPEQRAAMRRIRYRSYIVANVLLKKRLASSDLDCFRLVGEVPASAAESRSRPFTDLIFGAWAAHDKPDHSVLTLYKGVPYDGARGELIGPSAFGDTRAAFEQQVPELVRMLGISAAEVAGIRLTRWGHPLPLAETGLIKNGVLELARCPLDGRVFFAQQDNWCSPAFEPAFATANSVADEVRRALTGVAKL